MIPKRLRRAALRAHQKGLDATAFVGKQHNAIQKAAEGSMKAYRALRCEIVQLVINGEEVPA